MMNWARHDWGRQRKRIRGDKDKSALPPAETTALKLLFLFFRAEVGFYATHHNISQSFLDKYNAVRVTIQGEISTVATPDSALPKKKCYHNILK